MAIEHQTWTPLLCGLLGAVPPAVLRLLRLRRPGCNSIHILGTSPKPEPRMDWTPDFHMQAQVFTEKVSCQGLLWKKK